MARPLKSFLIITNTTKDPDLLFTRRVADCLQDMGCTVSLAGDEHGRNNGADRSSSLDGTTERNGEERPDYDCVITLGGDGTLIRAARNQAAAGVPILGINIGTLGYLTDADRHTSFDVLRKAAAGDYEIEHRMMLDGEISRNGRVRFKSSALNDIVLNRREDMSVMDFDIFVNGDFLTGYTADGVIVSTATGSTAYSLSCGGPFIEPSAKILMVTPICAHSLTGRSLIFDETTRINIRLRDRNNLVRTDRGVWFDGELSSDVQTGDEITITRSKRETLLVRTARCGFVQRLREKL